MLMSYLKGEIILQLGINFDQNNEEILDVITTINMLRMPRRRNSFARIFGLVLIILGIIIPIIIGNPLYIIVGLIFIALGAVEIYSSTYNLQKKRLKKSIRASFDMSLYSGTRDYDLCEEGITVNSVNGVVKYKWSDTAMWGECGDFMYVVTRDSRLLLIDKRQVSEDQVNGAKDIFKEYIG